MIAIGISRLHRFEPTASGVVSLTAMSARVLLDVSGPVVSGVDQPSLSRLPRVQEDFATKPVVSANQWVATCGRVFALETRERSAMDARQLEYFLAVVEHDGFGRAAQALHLAQPSLSQAIATLERDLRVPLFHRVGRGVVLSAAGEELIVPARNVLRDLGAARAAVESAKGARIGRVELVTMPSPGIEPLSTLIRRFAGRHPGMTVTAEAAFTADEVVQRVRHGAAEVGLAGTPEPCRPPGLEVLP